MTNEPKASKAAKIGISLPPEELQHLKAREDAGEIKSVSGHITSLLQREREAAEVDTVLARLFPGNQPGPEHEAWAAKVLGVTDSSGESSAA
ncbi:hypothetical protein P1P68_06120 [Streptomyces scabiei]|uniref:hypothetical protein n=1 Tax=Streptomyces scabiei TaxID=1930 RepID=UPI00298FFF6A|nr:hypothetical protein [Streptomyces scabiei]MDW8804379.1 hypothetical protein [Streptomyces scabiei]